MKLFDIVQKALFAGLGAQEKVKEFVDELVKKGELSKSEGAKLVNKWIEKREKGTEKLSKRFSELVDKALEKMNLPMKKDIEELEKKIEALTKKLEEKGKKE